MCDRIGGSQRVKPAVVFQLLRTNPEQCKRPSTIAPPTSKYGKSGARLPPASRRCFPLSGPSRKHFPLERDTRRALVAEGRVLGSSPPFAHPDPVWTTPRPPQMGDGRPFRGPAKPGGVRPGVSRWPDVFAAKARDSWKNRRPDPSDRRPPQVHTDDPRPPRQLPRASPSSRG